MGIYWVWLMQIILMCSIPELILLFALYIISQRTTEEAQRTTEVNYATLKLCEPLCLLSVTLCYKNNYTENQGGK